jgi:hypothetical protein
MFSNRVLPRKNPSSPDSIKRRYSRPPNKPRDTRRWPNKQEASLTQSNLTRRQRSRWCTPSSSRLPRVTKVLLAPKSLLISSPRFSPRQRHLWTSLALILKDKKSFSRNLDNLRFQKLQKSHWVFSNERFNEKIHRFKHQLFLSKKLTILTKKCYYLTDRSFDAWVFAWIWFLAISWDWHTITHINRDCGGNKTLRKMLTAP